MSVRSRIEDVAAARSPGLDSGRLGAAPWMAPPAQPGSPAHQAVAIALRGVEMLGQPQWRLASQGDAAAAIAMAIAVAKEPEYGAQIRDLVLSLLWLHAAAGDGAAAAALDMVRLRFGAPSARGRIASIAPKSRDRGPSSQSSRR